MSKSISSLKSRFRGSLLGVLMGDCFGAQFEGKRISMTTFSERFDQLTNSKTNIELRYTDDTAMTISTIKSLIRNKGLNPKHLAQEYTESFFREPGRGYGIAVTVVFNKLKSSQYQNPYEPAKEQFCGRGSFGNGAAMRCNGLALFAHKMNLDEKDTIELTENCSKLTHSNVIGVNGAILLVMAIRYVLKIDDELLDEQDFLDYLIKIMNDLEDQTDPVYTDKLKTIKRVIEQLSVHGTDVSQSEIVTLLGNEVSAQSSVPLAVYSFLRGISKFVDSYRIENEITRTLHWSISCGGDTDTIASMACGLMGAYVGMNKVPETLYKKCEAWQEMLNLADQLESMSPKDNV